MKILKWFVDPRVWAYGLFWSWNLIFFAFLLLGFAPLMLPDLIPAVVAGVIPVQFLIFAVILISVPVVAVVLGITLLRRAPNGLFALWYGIEGPLMLMLAMRFFLFRDLTPGVAALMTMATLGMATLLWQILDKHIDTRGPVLTGVRVIGLTVLLVIDLYASLWIAFYVFPVAAQIWNSIGSMVSNFWYALTHFDWRTLFTLTWAVPFSIFGGILLAYTATLAIGAPIVVPLIAIHSWQRGMRAMIAQSAPRAFAATSMVILACAFIFVLTNQQPQRAAFALLKNPPANPNEARALLDQTGTLRAGLLNTYLASFRYISAVGEVRHIGDLYRSALRLSPEQAADIEVMYNVVAQPFLYEPVNPPKADDRIDGRALREEPAEAAKLYKTFFDERIIDGEHETIVNAVRSTWSSQQAEAAWQAVDDREVLLTRQEITISENNDWAEVELYEVYQNQTTQRQEVVYYFSLPESAVVTGVWLGNSEDRHARFAYRVAPRGAAQAVYRNELRRNMDPALVEQIGPRQYRLRVFPIEPRRWIRDGSLNGGTFKEGPPMHMWLTYRVLARDNVWTMPRLAEGRNVYWDATTVRVVNGKTMSADAQAWLPASVAAVSPVKPTTHRVEFPSGESIVAQPVSASDLPRLPANLRLAVVVDRSRSMNKLAADVKATFARLSQISGAATDVYLTASSYRGEAPTRVTLNEFNADNIVYLGGQNAGELLAQFDQLRAGKEYDAILVVTDGSGYELGESAFKLSIPNTPVWMIHLGGNLPLGYDDATLEVIQASGGGASNNVEDALTRVAVALNRKQVASLANASANATADWVDGYVWLTASNRVGRSTPGSASISDNEGHPFAAFAARRVILDTMYRERASLKQLTMLDHLHDIAIKNSIVTPYSSMIVLVNTQQENLLKQLEKQGDRFEREVEEVGDTVPQAAVTGVPEPHEWLLIALAVAMLAGYAYKTRMGRGAMRA